jgi:hypothetical protein
MAKIIWWVVMMGLSLCIDDFIAGPVTKLSVLGKTVLFLTSPRMISELFAKRASTFSDRPHFIFSEEMYVLLLLNIPSHSLQLLMTTRHALGVECTYSIQ